MLTRLEQAASLLRRVGLGALVDRVGGTVGGLAARRVTTIDGVRLAGNHAGQLYYLRELAEGRDRFLVELLRRATPAGSTAVDAGAHIGYLTVHLARAVGPQGRVFAFEPEPAARRALARNLERNEVTARVTVLPHALGAGPSRGVLHIGGGGETSSLAPLAGERATAEVEVVALDDVLPQAQRVNVVKLDLEGAEVDALRGMTRILARSPDAVLLVECNPGRLEAMGSSREELLACLTALGFGAQLIEEDRRALAENVAVTGEYANLLCVRGQHAFEVLEEK